MPEYQRIGKGEGNFSIVAGKCWCWK